MRGDSFAVVVHPSAARFVDGKQVPIGDGELGDPGPTVERVMRLGLRPVLYDLRTAEGQAAYDRDGLPRRRVRK